MSNSTGLGVVSQRIRDELSFVATVALAFGGSFVMASISYGTVEAAGRRLKRLQPGSYIRPDAVAQIPDKTLAAP